MYNVWRLIFCSRRSPFLFPYFPAISSLPFPLQIPVGLCADHRLCRQSSPWSSSTLSPIVSYAVVDPFAVVVIVVSATFFAVITVVAVFVVVVIVSSRRG